MTYNGKTANVSIIRNTDIHGLAKAIRSIVQPILDIKYSAVAEEPYKIYYTAIIITEAA